MNHIDLVILGLIQGLTEFLPVSSSGHLVLTQKLLGYEHHSLILDLVAHAGTLFAVIWFYRNDLLGIIYSIFRSFRLGSLEGKAQVGLFILVATVPTGLIGFFLRDYFLNFFNNTTYVGVFFIVTAALLGIGHVCNTRNSTSGRYKSVGFKTAFLLGLAQALAIAPGISRSGTTISVGYMLGLKSEDAARFSFLMSIPAVLGAIVVGTDWSELAAQNANAPGASVLLLLFTSAFLTGLSALSLLVWLMKTKKIYIFSIYLIIAGSWTIFGLGG